MSYQELEAVIAGVTGEQGPFPLQEVLINGETRTVFGGLPENLRDLYLFAASYGDKDCLVYRQQRLSFGEVLGQVLKLADALSSRYGIGKGDRVAIAMRNCPEWCIAFMAITSIGAVAVPLNSWWQGEELAYALQDCEADLVFADGVRFSRMAGWLGQSGLAVIGFDTGGPPLPAGVGRLEPLLSAGDVPAPPSMNILPEDPALILYTSGTTGLPKGVLSTQRNVISAIGTWVVLISAINVLDGVSEQEPENQIGILMAIPLFHVTGLHSMFLLSLIIGRKVVMMHKWDVDQALELIQAERITHFNGVPTMSMELTNHPRLADFDLSSLMDVSSGGAARPAEQVAMIVERFPGATASAGYGLTETNAVGCVIGQDDYQLRPGSVGRPTAPLVEMKIVNQEGSELAAGEIGEIWIRSPAVPVGYLNLPEATAESFTDGWCHTGDLGYLDSDGFLYIVDRLKDIIIRGGENISCIEVEEALYAHPQIEEVAVFGLPDERLGEIVGAVVRASGGVELDSDGIREFLSERLAAFKIPVHLCCQQEQLPRIASGKIDKKMLRAEQAEQMACDD
jgi:acyl-CoA synthetase (AMP-forming)/AMP-acid ligase II